MFIIEIEQTTWKRPDLRQRLVQHGLDCMSILSVRLNNPACLCEQMRNAYIVLAEDIAGHESYTEDFTMDLIEMNAKVVVWPGAGHGGGNRFLADCDTYGLTFLRPLSGFRDLKIWDPSVGDVVEDIFCPRKERWFGPGDGYIRLCLGDDLSALDNPMAALLELAASNTPPVSNRLFTPNAPTVADYLWHRDCETAADEIIQTKQWLFESLKDLNGQTAAAVSPKYMNILWRNGYLPLSKVMEIQESAKEVT
jgi:hypothetical protein